MSDFMRDRNEERRLRILEAINGDRDGSMSETRLKGQLNALAWRDPIEVIRQDLRYLEQLSAIRIIDANGEMIAVLALLGRQHLARETQIEGVQPARHEF